MASPALKIPRMQRGMSEKEFKEGLRTAGLNAAEACLQINLRTGAAINPDDTARQFRRSTELSQRESAMWRLFFRYYRKPRNRAYATA